MLEVSADNAFDARLGNAVAAFDRRVRSTPPGICPLEVVLAHLQASACQTCGKCVPCRDGLPQLVALLERICACDPTADEALAERMRTLALMVRDASDCAIGYVAADALLASLDDFPDEYASHLGAVGERRCSQGRGQSVPCETACPAHVNVPAYIALAAQGDYAGSVAMVRKDNPFPTACGLICEHPCEARCRRKLIDDAINIRGIKKLACDNARADAVPVPEPAAPTGRRIAVIGGGPSGLTCAYFLALMGHEVDVLEARGALGGMMRYGIPAYRFPRERLDEDIAAILSLPGISVALNERVDGASFARIRDSYDAVFVAIGAHAARALDVPGEDAQGVMSAVDLLGRIGAGESFDFTGKRAVVIGGGNVAMDCARTAVRAGAQEVSVVYRRRLVDMTALPEEVAAAIAEGVEMFPLKAPVAIEVDDAGACTAVLVQAQMAGAVERGRPKPVPAGKPIERVEADVVLLAVGQVVASDDLDAAGLPFERGRITADRHLRTSSPGLVFAGGDCQSGPATVIRAIGAGKVAARNIDEALGFNHTLDCGVKVPAAAPNVRQAMGRVNIEERPARERKNDFEPVELEMSVEEARQECGRCLRCDVFGAGAAVGGRVQYA